MSSMRTTPAQSAREWATASRRRQTPAGSLWPTPTQVFLLQAALLSGAQAATALEEWKRQSDLRRLDYGSLTLLPLLYRNLEGELILVEN